MGKLHEKDFTMENYDDFYADHFFQPLDKPFDAHRILPRVNWALQVAKRVQPKSTLDLGCLDGYATLTLAKHVPSITRGVGIDLSVDGIEIAEGHAMKLDKDIEFQQGTIEDFLRNTTEKFDLIMLFEVIEHVEDPALLIELIDKVKTDNATILISTPSFESPLFGMDDEVNKCHIRLYTTKDESYDAVNKYGNTRTGTSMSKQIGADRIKDMGVYSELINVEYQ